MENEVIPSREIRELCRQNQRVPDPPPPPTSTAAPAPALSAEPLSLSPAREAAFITVICLAQFFTQAGLGSVLAILPILSAELGLASPNNHGAQAWLIAGYSLTVGTFILVAGRLGDLCGHRRVLLAGYVWFGLWSVVAGCAAYVRPDSSSSGRGSAVLFIFARVLSGVGPSLMMPNALAILGVAYPPSPRKELVFSLFGAVAPGACVTGAALAGVFALAWWPWFFWAMGIVLFAVAAVGWFVVPQDQQQQLSKKGLSVSEFVEALDALGGVMGVTALVLINFAWNQAGVVGWSESYVYVSLIIGLLLLPVFFWVEFSVARFPLLPFDVVNGDVGAVLVCIACGWGSFGIWIFYIFQFFEDIIGATPLLTVAWLSPMAISGAVASLTTAYLLGHTQPTAVMCIAMAAFVAGISIISTAPTHQIYWGQKFWTAVVMPFGMGMSFPAASLIISNAVPREKQGVGVSLVNTVVNYSVSVALGIVGTVQMHVTGAGQQATLQAYRSAWYCGLGLAGLGLLVSFVNLVMARIYRRSKYVRSAVGE